MARRREDDPMLGWEWDIIKNLKTVSQCPYKRGFTVAIVLGSLVCLIHNV